MIIQLQYICVDGTFKPAEMKPFKIKAKAN